MGISSFGSSEAIKLASGLAIKAEVVQGEEGQPGSGGASRITWEVVILSNKRRHPLGAIVEQHPTKFTNTTSITCHQS